MFNSLFKKPEKVNNGQCKLVIPEWPMQGAANLNKYYGNPDANNNGQPDADWEAKNLVTFTPPYPMVWSWSLQPVKTIKMHKACAPAFQLGLQRIGEQFSKEDRIKYQLDRCGGAYNFRLVRGSLQTLSTHSWGCAIDLAPELNGLGVVYNTNIRPLMMPKQVVRIFKELGMVWGGDFSRPDAMHFQAAKI